MIYGYYCIYMCLMMGIIRLSATTAFAHKNYYTINHYNYNHLFFRMAAQVYGAYALILWSQNNFGINPRNKCLKAVIHIICIILRICILCMFFSTFALVIRFWKETFYLNDKNWWRDEEKEPFITNEDYVNAGICWCIWLYAFPTMFLLLFCYFPLIIVLLIYTIFFNITAEQRRECLKSCCTYFCQGFKYLILG